MTAVAGTSPSRAVAASSGGGDMVYGDSAARCRGIPAADVAVATAAEAPLWQQPKSRISPGPDGLWRADGCGTLRQVGVVGLTKPAALAPWWCCGRLASMLVVVRSVGRQTIQS